MRGVLRRQRALGLGHQATNDARDRRILTGEEVLLSLKSVDDLKSARPSYATTHTPTDMSSILFSNHTSTNDIEPPAFFWPFLTSSFVGGFDPFSALPDTTGDPLPKSILIEYCKHHLLFIGEVILILESHPTTWSVAWFI